MKKILFALLVSFLLIMPQQAHATEQMFTDVTDATQNAILKKLVSEKLIYGYSTGTFKPSQAITRAQMAVIIDLAYDLTPIREKTVFKDVPTSHQNYAAIQALYQAGIVDGSNGNFNPETPVKRVHVAKILTNLLELEQQTTNKFKDVLLNDVNNGYIGALVQKRITTGFPDGTFKPYQSVTRMQFSTFLYRSLYGKEQQIKNRIITSNTIYAPTKLASAKYLNGMLFADSFLEEMKFDKEGNLFIDENLDPTIPLTLLYFTKEGIYGAQDGTSKIFMNVDLRNLEEFKTRITKNYLGRSFDTVTFDHDLTVANTKFLNVTKLTSYEENYKSTMTYFFKEGYGILKITSGNSVAWELKSYKLR